MSEGREGIELAAAEERGRITISGTFRIPVDDRYDHYEVGQSALVLVVASKRGYGVYRPFRRRVPMQDDVVVSGPVAIGRFEFDLAEFAPAPLAGRYDVLVSLGRSVSDVLSVEV